MICHLNGSEFFDNSATELIRQFASYMIDKFLPFAIRKAFPMNSTVNLICIVHFKVEYT